MVPLGMWAPYFYGDFQAAYVFCESCPLQYVRNNNVLGIFFKLVALLVPEGLCIVHCNLDKSGFNLTVCSLSEVTLLVMVSLMPKLEGQTLLDVQVVTSP